MLDQALSFGVLGAVSVHVDGIPVPIAAPRQRAMLAMLLVCANKSVSSSKLIEGIWGESPPQHPESALHIVVCRLRQVLGAAACRLVRDTSGYRIEIAPDELDLSRAHTLAAASRVAMEHGDAARAAELLDDALDCWTGEALSDVSTFPFCDEASRRIREFQLATVEDRNAAYFRCGRHLEVLADIETWVEPNPWRERLRAHQMVALYLSGRQIEALAVYEDLRRLLVTDFGVNPHEDLQRLHGRILQGDPTLLAGRKSFPRKPLESIGA